MPFDVIVPDRLVGVDVGAAYREVRERIADFTSGLSDDEWERSVPHCPQWSIRQTIAHLAGVVDDAINSNLDGVASDPWTAAQVAKRADLSGPEIVDEWMTYGPFVDARATQVGLGMHQLLFDAVNHEHDLRYAVSKPGAWDSDALWIGAHFVCARINPGLRDKGLHPIAIVVDRIAMTEPAPVELHGSVFDIVRAACARRSVAQVSRMHWTGDAATRYFDKLFPFAPPQEDILE